MLTTSTSVILNTDATRIAPDLYEKYRTRATAEGLIVATETIGSTVTKIPSAKGISAVARSHSGPSALQIYERRATDKKRSGIAADMTDMPSMANIINVRAAKGIRCFIDLVIK